LRRLLQLADKHFPDKEAWIAERLGLQAMVDQRVTGGNLNFRHGATYCSPSEQTAVRYALSNAQGSELLSSCITVYARLRALVPEQVSFLESDYREIYSLALAQWSPVLFEIHNVSADSLCTEQGGDASDQIREASNDSGPVGMAILEQCNFELLFPIASTNLTVWRIIVHKFDISNLEYELLPYIAEAAHIHAWSDQGEK
jgi:hypothetical protein